MFSLIITNILKPITKHSQIWELMGYGRRGAIYIDDPYYILKIIGLNTFL
jgi:hypothetical protein